MNKKVDKKLLYLKEHLTYELLMLRYTAKKISQAQQQLDWNAYFESFAIHARGLYHFLVNDGDPRNFEAKHFASYKAKKTNETIRVFEKIHFQVLHMGKRREESEKVTLNDVAAVTKWVEENINGFASQLNEPYRSKWDPNEANVPKEESLMVMGPTMASATNVVLATRLDTGIPRKGDAGHDGGT
jgi:hypothetical protein